MIGDSSQRIGVHALYNMQRVLRQRVPDHPLLSREERIMVLDGMPCVELAVLFDYWDCLYEQNPTTTLLFDVASLLDVEQMGALGWLLQGAHTVHRALSRVMGLLSLWSDAGSLKLDVQHGEVLLSYNPLHALETTAQCLSASVVLVEIWHIAQQLGVPMKPKKVSLALEMSNAERDVFQSRMGCVVEQSQSLVLFIEPSWLAMEFSIQAPVSPYLQSFYEDVRTSTHEGIVPVVEYMMHHITDGPLTADQVAKHCHMSSRSFRRFLEPWSFRQLLNTCRIERTCALLVDSNCSLAEIAFLVGYSEQSSFQRAFAKHMGITPLKWRQLVCSG